jgi:hypothetical protein
VLRRSGILVDENSPHTKKEEKRNTQNKNEEKLSTGGPHPCL